MKCQTYCYNGVFYGVAPSGNAVTEPCGRCGERFSDKKAARTQVEKLLQWTMDNIPVGFFGSDPRCKKTPAGGCKNNCYQGVYYNAAENVNEPCCDCGQFLEGKLVARQRVEGILKFIRDDVPIGTLPNDPREPDELETLERAVNKL